MRFSTISALFILALASSCRQPEIVDCKSALEKTPYFTRYKYSENRDSLEMDFEMLRDCGKLDSVDIELLDGSFLASMMIQLTAEGKALTYKNVLKTFEEYKKTENYARVRDAILTSKRLENKIVTRSGFKEDRQLLLKAGMPEPELARFEAFMESRMEKGITYREAFIQYSAFKANTLTPAPQRKENGEQPEMGGMSDTAK